MMISKCAVRGLWKDAVLIIGIVVVMSGIMPGCVDIPSTAVFPSTPDRAQSNRPNQVVKRVTISRQPFVQFGAFRSRVSAERTMAAKMREFADNCGSRQDGYIKQGDAGALRVLYRLRIGPFPSYREAKTFCRCLKHLGSDCFVVTDIVVSDADNAANLKEK